MKLSQQDQPLPEIAPEVQALAARIPLFADATDLHIAPLAGVISLNNTSYRVEAGGATYLLRVGAETARYLGIRREEEIEAARAAAKAGVAPDVLYSEPTGVMVMPFIVGKHWDPDAFHEPANIARLAATLRRLHAVTTVAAQGSEYRRIEWLLESAVALGLELPPNSDDLRAKLARIERERTGDPRYVPGLAHNDFWANNFLDDGERLYLVDWEFSGTGEPLIDLATISMAGRYSEEEQYALLRAYGLTEPGDLATLQTMKWVVTLFEGAWALVMHGIRGSGAAAYGEEGDYNYSNHAHTMFERLNTM
jgi:thiamine kinase-like enzyme